MSTLFVIAKITPKPEFFEQAKNALLAIISDTLNEPECLQFVLHQDSNQENLFLYEEFENELALKLHHEQPYTQAVMRHYEEWLAAPLEITILSKLTPS